MVSFVHPTTNFKFEKASIEFMQYRIIFFCLAFLPGIFMNAQVLSDSLYQQVEPETQHEENVKIPLFGSWNKNRAKSENPADILENLQGSPLSYTLNDSIFNALNLPDSIFNMSAIDSVPLVDTLISSALDSIISAEKDSAIADTLPIKPDIFQPLWQISIRSLPASERLSSAYKAALEVNNRTYFNRYRIVNWDTENDVSNPYSLDIIPYFDHKAYRYLPNNHPSLYSTHWFSGDTTTNTEILNQTTALEVFIASRNTIIKNMPQLVTNSWDDLPDPPRMNENSYLSNITNLKLDYAINDRNMISAPEKLSKKLIEASPWRVRGNTSLQLSQSTVTEWENGGDGFFSLLGIVTMDANYNKNNFKWENYGEMRLGALQQEGETMRKNEHRIRTTSNAGVKFSKKSKWYYSGNLDLNTQLFNSYKNSKEEDEFPESGFLAPVRFYLSAGMDYKDKKGLSVFLSPLTYKLTYVRDTAKFNEQKFGIPDGANKKEEMGGYIRAEVNHKLAKQVHLKSKLYFFTDYKKFMRRIDMDWENIVDFQINHLLSARMSFHFRYDDDVKFKTGTTLNENGEEVAEYGPKLQFKELLSIGFNYRF